MTAAPIDAALAERLLRHEAAVHAVPGRTLRELGDAILLHDPVDPEPFWNRMEALHLPYDTDAFDRRLAELSIVFAAIGRQPHLWVLPTSDEPPDLYERLIANGFEDAGASDMLVAACGDIADAVGSVRPDPDVTVERWSGMRDEAAERVAAVVVEVVLASFAVPDVRRSGLVSEIVASLGDPRFTLYMVRRGGEPVAVGRRASFDGLSYLSSIGTIPTARGLGLGRLVTATAAADAVAAGGAYVHLGVFHENLVAKRLYASLGFRPIGGPGRDMLLIG